MMLRFFCAFTLGACLALSAAAQSYDVRTDKALATPITLSVKYSPIDSVLKSMSKQSGVLIEATGPLADLKLTIYVKNVPCNLVLARIESVVMGRCKNLEGTRIISQDLAVQKQQSDYLTAEDVVLRSKAEEDLKAMLKRAEDANNQEEAASAGGSPLPRHGGRNGFSRVMLADEIAPVLANAGQSELDAFWHGTVADIEVTAENIAPLRLPGSRRRTTQDGATDSSVVFARYDYFGTHMLQIGSSRFPVFSQRFEIPTFTKPEDSLAETKFGKNVLAWSNQEQTNSGDLYKKPLPGQGGRKVGFGVMPPNPTQSEAQDPPLNTQSDLLEKFFKTTGIPVVADGYRISLPAHTAEPKGDNPANWIKALSDETGCFVQVEDGITTVRQGGFWRLRQFETPESSLLAMEANSQKLGLMDYAKFFGGLTPAQVASFQSSTPPKVGFEFASLVEIIPALRIIGTLPGDFPTIGKPVPVSELGGDTLNFVNEAISHSTFIGKQWNKTDAAINRENVLCISLRPSEVPAQQGTVSGVTLEILLPIGETITYEVPLSMGS